MSLRYPCLAWPVDIVFMVRCSFFARNVLVTAIQRCLNFSFTPGHYYVMTLWAFGFEAIGVNEGSNFKLLWSYLTPRLSLSCPNPSLSVTCSFLLQSHVQYLTPIWTNTSYPTRSPTYTFLTNICCGYSKEPFQWDGSFEHPKHMLKTRGKKIFTILRWNFVQFIKYSFE